MGTFDTDPGSFGYIGADADVAYESDERMVYWYGHNGSTYRLEVPDDECPTTPRVTSIAAPSSARSGTSTTPGNGSTHDNVPD